MSLPLAQYWLGHKSGPIPSSQRISFGSLHCKAVGHSAMPEAKKDDTRGSKNISSAVVFQSRLGMFVTSEGVKYEQSK